jgi:hypothetical protein
MREHDVGREVVPLAEAPTRAYEQSPFTFGAINGAKIADRVLEVVSLPRSPIQFVPASDRYPIVMGTLQKSERYLEEVLGQDPLCIKRHIATKGMKKGNISFGDRAYRRAEVQSNAQSSVNPPKRRHCQSGMELWNP